jgi:methionyl-tRNA formyltransferase
MNPLRICFAGTPDFAVPSLAALLASRHEMVLVVTQPDRPAGRRRHLTPPPVKLTALEHGAPVIQPESLNRPEALEALRAARPDALVVVAYGNILSRRALAVPAVGCFNVHASLLPCYRGAAPITYAILNGDRETGVTVQRVVYEVDAGPVLARRAVKIGPDETAGALSDRLARLGGEMLVPVLDAVERGEARELPQDPARVTHAPKLSKEDGAVPWERDAESLHDFVRAMTPWPGAFARLYGPGGEPKGRVVLLAVSASERDAGPASPGDVVEANEELLVATGRGCLSVRRVKPEGGREMDVAAFLHGHSVKTGDRFRGA